MTIRVAVVVPWGVVDAWIATLVERLATSSFDVQVYRDAPASRPRSPWAYPVYELLDARIFFRAEHDALEPMVPFPRLPLADLDETDVVIHFGSSELHTPARYGVWRLRVPPLFWELHAGTPYRTTLEVELPGGERRLLYDSRGRPDRTSLHRTRNQAYWKALGAIVRALETVRERGADYLASRPLAGDPDPAAVAPGTPTVLRHVARVSLGVLARRLRKLGWREEWLVAARPVGTVDFRPFEAAPGDDLADPFVVEHDGATYVFCERLEPGAARGSIAYVRLDGSARPAGPPVTVLMREYHVSYPFVFSRGGDVYMIPESIENESVDLYRAVDFPSSSRRRC